jgi:thiamine transport system substrate-binding protein
MTRASPQRSVQSVRPAVPILPSLVLAALLAAGCSQPGSGASESEQGYAGMGFDGTTWPDLHGARVVVLDHGAFDYIFGPAKERFEALTNGTLEHIAAQDTGDALNRAIREKSAPSFDVVYGLDNAYLGKAVAAGALRPYTPVSAHRVNASYLFFGDQEPWPATPADHGYIAVNVDPRANLTVNDLIQVERNARHFVTQDPRTSSPGLGFLLATIATYGEGKVYDWQDYWRDLFADGVTVTADWTTAYTAHFTGGYGQHEPGFAGTKPLVTSYTSSPAYELYYEAAVENQLVLAPGATFHQVETVALAAEPRDLAAAQAFIEFVLSDGFQDLHAEYNAMYPVVDGIDVAKVYGGADPAPGSFEPAALPYGTLAGNVERWVREWTDLYEAHQAE